MRRAVLLAVAMLFGAAGPGDGGTALRASLLQFLPARWETGDCPASYGPDAVLCAGTDTGPFKVDHHVPTAWIRTPAGGREAAGEAGRREAERKGFRLAGETRGRCASPSAPCLERTRRGPSADAPRVLEYVVCPAGGPPLLVGDAVSARVDSGFLTFARRQVRWSPGPGK